MKRGLQRSSTMQVIAEWKVDTKKIQLLHEAPKTGERARWEFRVNGELWMYGYGRPREARSAVYTRRKLT